MPKARNDSSQFGEDGLIEALLAHIGETNRWCFECGAHDGLYFSNTKRLRDLGWSAVLIEADDKLFDKLAKHATEKVRCVRQMVVGNDLDNILSRNGAPVDLDLGVLDIDSQEWHVWNAMTVYRPRVFLVEHSGHQDSAIPPQGSAHGQAGLKQMMELGVSKGYVPLISTTVNLLCVRADVWAVAPAQAEVGK